VTGLPPRRREARRSILLRYPRSVVAATPTQVTRPFGWTAGGVIQAAAQLEEAGLIRSDVSIEGLPGAHLVVQTAHAH
jgi:hypothetical protein